MHVHTLNGIAVSAQRGGLLPISQQSLFVLSSLAYHDYEGVALRAEEQPRLVHDLGDNTFLMLRNHGLLTAAGSMADAFLAMYVFEAACTIQVRAQSGGGELIPIAAPILERHPRRGRAGHARHGRRARLAGPAAPARPGQPRLRRLAPRSRRLRQPGRALGLVPEGERAEEDRQQRSSTTMVANTAPQPQ